MLENNLENELTKKYKIIDITGTIKDDAINAFNKIIPHLTEKYIIKFDPIDNPYEGKKDVYSVTGEYTYISRILKRHKKGYVKIAWTLSDYPSEKQTAEFLPSVNFESYCGGSEFSSLKNLDEIIEAKNIVKRK